MNIQECDILRTLAEEPFVNQRILAETTGHSLGVVNRSIKILRKEGYLDEDVRPTAKAEALFQKRAPRSAVILAAGFGMRMVPINTLVPKAMLEVKGEPLIERQIRQLHEAGVFDITVVVGFLKESFDYLIDQYGVKLVCNPLYASKNNLYSLSLAAGRLSNTYIVPCDLWCAQNPFHRRELYSWYMVSDREAPDAGIRVNRKMELTAVSGYVRSGSGNGGGTGAAGGRGGQWTGNAPVGIAYVLEEDCEALRDRLREMAADSAHDGDYWEAALLREDGRMRILAKVVSDGNVVEINTYEQLRELDSESGHLRSDALDVIAQTFGVSKEEIVDITVLKKGMTNRSFLFTVRNEKYIMRIPGEGTDQLIDRRQEAAVYAAISGKGLCDDPVYINPENGYKITKFLDGVRTADPESETDLARCMKRLRDFHRMGLKVDHAFDIFGQIDFYESLWEGNPSVYRDYRSTKEKVLALRPFIDGLRKDRVLTHIDAVPDNFLFYHKEGEAEEALQLTDWEYAGMQDPHVDIAMFCIYSLYEKEQADRLIDLYFDGACDTATRAKIYCYIAACGLLWSNWCEYKRRLGVEFGEYSLRQYRYAKDFSRYAAELMRGGTDARQSI
ncbi:MAG: NTP transferase domain-containing protein [Lachnospiraceae bacterium]|nr:NTP transferase domain-containing protein [Lachnospiraceae bacterium]